MNRTILAGGVQSNVLIPMHTRVLYANAECQIVNLSDTKYFTWTFYLFRRLCDVKYT